MNRVQDHYNQLPLNQRGAPSTRQPNLKYWASQMGYATLGCGFIVVVKVLVFAGLVGIISQL